MYTVKYRICRKDFCRLWETLKTNVNSIEDAKKLINIKIANVKKTRKRLKTKKYRANYFFIVSNKDKVVYQTKY